MMNISKGIIMKKDLGDAPLTIGGLLFLVAVRLIIGIAGSGNSILQTFGLQLNMTGQAVRAISALLVIYAFVVLSLFFKRHKAFPAAYIVMESLNLMLSISELFILYSISSLPMDAMQIIYIAAPVFISILWILYMLLSVRVKRTFVYGRNELADQSLIDKTNGI